MAVTAGYITPKTRKDFFAHMDAANVDLKAFSERFYAQLCLGSLEPVLDTLKWLKRETNVWFEVTTLLIPGQNDSNEEIEQLCGWFADNLGPEVPLHFTAFHPDFKMLDVPITPPATLRRARNLALATGIHHVYTGNVWDAAGQSTYCAACGNLLIERDWYHLGAWKLDEMGCCSYCGAKLSGLFEKQPGQWGARRVPIKIVR